MRTFLAIPIPTETEEQIAKLQRELRVLSPDLAWVPVANFHLTLLFLGEVGRKELAAVSEALAGISQVSPFKLAVDKLGIFGSNRNPKVLWLGFGEGEREVTTLAGLVQTALGRKEAFHPHLTLARFRDRPLGKLGGQLGPLSREIGFTACEVVLYESKLGAGPPRYLPLKTWKLEGAET